ncbi:MAG: MBL fold metallo-hydrolase [Gloeobacteraceae cyanobacterium ES-bin-144]|nr:MBL fold metallo-hydrolase [Verrucomicrobiales bacterium]
MKGWIAAMLENDFTEVCGKALRGLQLTPGDLAAATGLPLVEVNGFLRGIFSSDIANKIAVALGLNTAALMHHPGYQPMPICMDGIQRLDLSFDEDRVNAWVIRKGDDVLVFDAGYDAVEWLQAVELSCGRMPDAVFITHGHIDHVGALGNLLDRGVAVHSANLRATTPMKADDEVRCGPMTVLGCDLSGHFTPSLGFSVEGFPTPVLVVGDALFAGSIGRCTTPANYRHSLQRMRSVFTPLPDSTILLPGHGPATTLGEERESNPFL